MNKKFTMVCASLLLASAFSVNAASVYTPDVKLVEYGTQIKAINLADGVKFYLKKDNNYYLTVGTVSANETEFTSFVTSQNSFEKASVFEVRNLETVTDGVVFELYVDGKKLSVSSETGSTVTNKDKVVSKFFSPDKTTDVSSIVTYVVNGIGKNLCAYNNSIVAYTTSLNYKAEDLKDFNNEGTTFSFNFSDEELVGNLFKDLTPVTVNKVTYFLKGDKASELTGFTVGAIKDKGIQILAIDNKTGYGLNSSVKGEGLKLRMVDAEKFLLKEDKSDLLDAAESDSLTLAGFTSILEADQLNNAKEIVLTMTPKDGLLGNEASGNFNIAAVKTEKNANNAYVTTVKAENKSSWAVYKNALLGDNTYFPASEFLRDKMRAVAILNVNGNAENNKNYYKYLVESTLDATPNNVVYKPASEIDFEMPQNQWVVSNFDGKYTLTLNNRLTNQQIVLSNITKTENGYNARLKGANSNELDGSISFKLLDLATSKTDGYKVLSDDEIKNGITLSFTGETQLAGEKEFFAVKDGNKMVPSLDTENLLTLYPIANLNDKKEDKVLKGDLEYAYLKDGKMATEKDTLVVPTYFLATDLNDDGTAKTIVGSDYAIGAKDEVVWAFAKNIAGNYSAFKTRGNDILAYAKVEVSGVKYNKDATTNPDGLAFTSVSRYKGDDVVNAFASVNVNEYNKLKTSLPAVPGHYTFDNARGSINVKDLVGINEGFLASEGQVFWLDTADVENEHPSFYISFGKDSVAARNYMFNPIDSAKVFDEFTAKYKYNDVYYYGEDAMVDESKNEAKGTLKVAFASTVAEKGKDLADAFKFNITLKDDAVADEYVLTSVKDNTLRVAQKNGVVILVNKDNKEGIEPMAFTVNPAEAPTSNESVVASEVKVVANNGSVVVKNAAGKNVVVSTILGQVVANEVLTSDNATINVPAGIVVVAVDGESFKVSVK